MIRLFKHDHDKQMCKSWNRNLWTSLKVLQTWWATNLFISTEQPVKCQIKHPHPFWNVLTLLTTKKKKTISVSPPAPVGLVASLDMFVYRWCYLCISAGTETQKNDVGFLKMFFFCSYHMCSILCHNHNID